jgi:hypothetical protein
VLALAFAPAPVANAAVGDGRPDVLPLLPAEKREVPAKVMRCIYDEVKTPCKYGVVLKGETKYE